jgi:hypothetical protein
MCSVSDLSQPTHVLRLYDSSVRDHRGVSMSAHESCYSVHGKDRVRLDV